MQSRRGNGVDWNWQINPESGVLCLLLQKQICFQTVFKVNDLSENLMGKLVNQPMACFTTSDAFVYSLFRDKFLPLPINEEYAFTLAVNATVASHYLKPQATKSWFYSLANNDLCRSVQQGDWVTLNAENEAIYLVLETDQHASNVMLISQSHVIDESRTFKRGKVLRVHNDRLSPVLYELQEHQL